MKYYLVVGEASGDLHASNLMRALKEEDTEAEFRFFGGDLMSAVGGTKVKHYNELAYMGFIPVLTHLPTIFRYMDLCERDILAWRPNVVILVDYPGFNLRIAAYLKKHSSVPVYYYISPKIWAWKEYRIKYIKRDVDELFSILPFEVDFYDKHQYPIHYVGNPCVDAVDEFKRCRAESFDSFIMHNGFSDKPIIALLPGSRRQEIRDNLPLMLEAASSFEEDYQLIVAGAPGIDESFYRDCTEGAASLRLVHCQTYGLLQQAAAALVISGTATLETCLFRVPQAVCYYTPVGKVIAWLRRHILKVPYISLVNLIAGKEVVAELVADKMRVANIRSELKSILYDTTYRRTMLEEYDRIICLIGEPGASRRAARQMIACLKSNCP